MPVPPTAAGAGDGALLEAAVIRAALAALAHFCEDGGRIYAPVWLCARLGHRLVWPTNWREIVGARYVDGQLWASSRCLCGSAGSWSLDWPGPAVIERLRQLGAHLGVCP